MRISAAGSPTPLPRVCVVSDRPTRKADLFEPLRTVSAPELIWWAGARRLRGPFAALLADVGDSPLERAALFERWAMRAWQPAAVVFLEPVHESALFAARLAELGYARVRYLEAGAAVDRVASLLRSVLERRLWLVGLLARELRCTHPSFLRVIALALDDRLPARTVREWATRCSRNGVADITTAADLRSLLHDIGAPSPKPLLDRLRLAAVIAHAPAEPRATRESLARRFGFASGDFLGRTAKRLTDAPFGELRGLGIPEAISRLLATH